MKILITGATGFVGRTLTRRLLADGHSLCLLVRNEEKMKKLFPSENYRHISLKDSCWTDEVAKFNPEITIHLAAYFTGRNDLENAEKLVESNLLFPVQLLCALRETDCKAFVNTGTFSEYQYGAGKYCANNLYSATKTALRPILDFFSSNSEMKWINVVVYSPYGRKNESKKVIDYLVDALGSAEPVGFSDGHQILDFIHVDDMADFYIRLLERIDTVPNGEEFQLGSGKGYSIREVGAEMERVFGKKLNAAWGKIPRRPNDHIFTTAPIANNIRLLDWQARLSLTDGLRIFREDLQS